MSDLRLLTIRSTAELRSQADRWDALWQVSDSRLPSLRAELLAQWIEHFMPHVRMRMLAVEQGGRFVAALPLVSQRWAVGWEAGEMTGNCWCPAADLLLDPQADCDAALDVMVAEFKRSPCTMVHFQAIDRQSDRWQRWLAALQRHGAAYFARDRFPIALVRISDSWPDYVGSLSRNHKRQMRRADRKASGMGGVDLRIARDLGPNEGEPLLRRGFEVEDRNWKGRAGSSVLSVPGVFGFFLAQARQLAAAGELLLVTLEHQGQPIAFEYAWLCKGVYQPVKVGYDEAFADLTPSQLLRWRLFEQMHQEDWCQAVDFLGPRTRATGAWANDETMLSRLVMAPRKLAGRVALHAYANWWPQLRRLRGNGQQAVETSDVAEESCSPA